MCNVSWLTLFSLLIGLSTVGYASIVSGSQESDITDLDIMVTIEDRLSKDEGIPAHLIDVISRNGIVTVQGSVDSLLAKERVVQRVSRIKNVRAVINRLRVEPSFAIKDSMIQVHVERALLDNPATELYDLHVFVENGIVTLEGTVQAWQEKQLSMTVAKGVRGVRDVQEKIIIKTVQGRSDRAIAYEIAQRLKYDVWIAHDGIHVQVLNGIVTLSGEVHSVEEKNRAGRKAWVFGVTSVNTDQLQVNRTKQDPMQKRGLTQVPDHEIHDAVRQAFIYDPRLPASDIEVDIKHGTVTLQGTVAHLEAKLAAEQNAKNTMGVYRVFNLLKVRPVHSASDVAIENRVGAALERDPYLSQEALEVSVHDGRVYLNGKVPMRFQKSQAETIASRIKGVVQVVNRIHAPFTWLWKSDWEIRQDVRRALQWNPHLAQSNIRIHVEDGEVTIEGTVKNTQQSHLAQHIAYDMGARSVRNKLDALPLH